MFVPALAEKAAKDARRGLRATWDRLPGISQTPRAGRAGGARESTRRAKAEQAHLNFDQKRVGPQTQHHAHGREANGGLTHLGKDSAPPDANTPPPGAGTHADRRTALPGRHEEEAGRAARAGRGRWAESSRPVLRNSRRLRPRERPLSSLKTTTSARAWPGDRPRNGRARPAVGEERSSLSPECRAEAAAATACEQRRGLQYRRPGPAEPTLGFSRRSPNPKPQPRGPRLRGPAPPGSDRGPVLSQSEPHALRAQAPAHPAGGPHLGLLVSTLPLTSGTSPALRAPRGGWNPGDLAVVAEAVEACLRSPWKPPQARSRGGLRGASPPRGRPGPQLPPAERPPRSRKPS